ncbi:hypothetical protein FAM09_23265 [Niastella caeni]|uniref:Fucose-specific lectin n=1 Tax=Niastella caeni TaxID=2569763 RepID=A0A4S8HMH6_9BACT|nr:hypothetical protein FAM09_23265 [Niastella caeni]
MAGAPSDVARGKLRALINNVKGATMRRYAARDNAGHTLDCIKIIANPYVSGQFIGVSHAVFNGVLKVNLAVSTDLVNWTWVRELAGSNNGQASQPTIAVASDGGFVVAWEQEPNNHIKVVYFSNWTNLQAGVVAKSYDCPRTLSTCAEGTPNLYSASSTRCDIGHHFYSNCTVDREARGTLTNFSSWTTSAQSNVDNAMLYWGVKGNIGDRDGYTNYLGYNFGLIEGQYTANDWSSWRVFLYDYQTGNADTTTIKTDGGSTAFANPTITKTQLNGQNIMLVTLFIPSEGAAAGEAGELIYYSKY